MFSSDFLRPSVFPQLGGCDNGSRYPYGSFWYIAVYQVLSTSSLRGYFDAGRYDRLYKMIRRRRFMLFSASFARLWGMIGARNGDGITAQLILQRGTTFGESLILDIGGNWPRWYLEIRAKGWWWSTLRVMDHRSTIVFSKSLIMDERERDLFFAGLARLWAYGGCLKCSMSIRLRGVYLAGWRPFYLWYNKYCTLVCLVSNLCNQLLYKCVLISLLYAIFFSHSAMPTKQPCRGCPLCKSCHSLRGAKYLIRGQLPLSFVAP